MGLLKEKDIIRPNIVFIANGGSVHRNQAGNSAVVSSTKRPAMVVSVTPSPIFERISTVKPFISSQEGQQDNAEESIITENDDNDVTIQHHGNNDVFNHSDKDTNHIEDESINEIEDVSANKWKHSQFLMSLVGVGRHPSHMYYSTIYPVNNYFYLP